MTNHDFHLLAEKLAHDCLKAGLVAEVLAPTRFRVAAPGGHARRRPAHVAPHGRPRTPG